MDENHKDYPARDPGGSCQGDSIGRERARALNAHEPYHELDVFASVLLCGNFIFFRARRFAHTDPCRDGTRPTGQRWTFFIFYFFFSTSGDAGAGGGGGGGTRGEFTAEIQSREPRERDSVERVCSGRAQGRKERSSSRKKVTSIGGK